MLTDSPTKFDLCSFSVGTMGFLAVQGAPSLAPSVKVHGHALVSLQFCHFSILDFKCFVG